MPIARFAIETAMRRGDTIVLQWRDVDMARRSAHIRQSKNGHSRSIPLTGAALDILSNLNPHDGSDMHVFPTTAMAVRMSWQRLLSRAGVTDLHFHDLRHEAISRLLERGGDGTRGRRDWRPQRQANAVSVRPHQRQHHPVEAEGSGVGIDGQRMAFDKLPLPRVRHSASIHVGRTILHHASYVIEYAVVLLAIHLAFPPRYFPGRKNPGG